MSPPESYSLFESIVMIASGGIWKASVHACTVNPFYPRFTHTSPSFSRFIPFIVYHDPLPRQQLSPRRRGLLHPLYKYVRFPSPSLTTTTTAATEPQLQNRTLPPPFPFTSPVPKMDIPADLIAQFMRVTNASEPLASQLLRDSGLNLEAAISSFFAIQEAGGLPPAASRPDSVPSDAGAENGDVDIDDPPPPPLDPSDDDAILARALAESDAQASAADRSVREPIPQIVDTLLPPRSVAPSRRTAPTPPDPFANSDGTARGDGLAALFRRPTHLNFSESFDHAMTAGQRRKKWLLVNMQRSDVFACHIMNRDVWADPAIEALVQDHFIFWQRDEATPDGAHYKQFYRYARPPHVALIDPRSGERLRAWGGDGEPVDTKLIRTALNDFVRRNSLDSDAYIPSEAPPTRPGAKSSAAASAARPGSSADDDDVAMTDDAALAAAIAASMEQPGQSGDSMESADAGDAGASAANGVQHGGPYGMDVEDDRVTSRLLSATDPALNRNRSLRAQQDNEFEESLALDRAKELSQQAEADRIVREAEEAERKAKTVAEVREMKRRRVPAMPGPDCTERITELAIRLPTGGRLQRKFRASDTIGNVYDYVESEAEELADGNFELMQAYPRKRFTDRALSLEELAPKAALVVHLKD